MLDIVPIPFALGRLMISLALKFKAMDENGDGELGFMEFEPGG